jgi:ribosome maturation factor RimP
MIEKAVVEKIVEEALKDTEKYLIGIKIDPSNKITVEFDSDQGITIDDCIILTKQIESQLDRDVEDYELEVSSAGIGQPFKVLRQYMKNVGNEVEVLAKDGKKYTGLLKTADENQFVLTVEKQVKPEGAKRKITIEEDLTFAYHEIKYTKYVIRFK